MLAKEKCCAVCLSCGNTLDQNEQPIIALRGKWHPACFKCSECKRVLSAVYFARDNVLFCRKDYFMKFRSTCHACERIITGPVMVVADHKFHTECFSCWYCQRFLGEEDNYAILERHRLVCFLCLKKDLEQPWWSSSLHAVYHFHLTAFNCERHKIEVEVVKSARGVPLQSACTQKEPNQAIIVIKGFNLKEFDYNMPVVSPGDVVLEVNRVVVSPNSIDRVATLLTSRPEEITQITVEHNETGFQAKSNSRRKHSSDSDSEPNDDKNIRTRSISLFSRRHLAQLAPSLSAEIYPHNGEVTFDVNGKKITKPAMRSNSLPRSNSYTDALRERSAIHRAQSFKQETVSNRVFRPCDLVIGDVIGKGFFGQVRKVTHRETGEVMVLKEMLHYDEDASSGFLKEVALLKSLNHPNVLRFIGILYRDKVLNLIIEYISGGTLRQILKDKGKELSWLQRVKFAKDIAAGMAYLHSMSVMHRDLNSRNCLVATDEGSGEMSVVVADFGLARVVRDRPASPNHHFTSGLWPSSAGTRPPTCPGQKPPPPKKRYTVVGSPYWMAPEMLNGLTYNEQVDVFSFGITMCEIIGRVKADPDYMPRTSKFGLDEKKFKAEFCESCPELFYKIAFLCCDLDPDKRPEFSDLEKWLESLALHLEVGLPLPSGMVLTLLPSGLMTKISETRECGD
ncbi:LIM domain kinase 1-like [Montipora capricornis]|uniref:LIM domain kinase 1-like n=1 Tax=Montipora capricornis TaxID=246305 RepID=UPI0035F12588